MPQLLIVDDTHEILSMLLPLLEDNGYACRSAVNACQAKSLLAFHKFDLMISDIVMPGESGVDLSRFARSHYPDMAQIIMTAENDPEVAETFLKAGVYGFVLKPFSIHQMLITVQNALIRRDLETEAAQMCNNLETQVKKRTKALRRSEEKMRQVLDNIGIGVVVIDPAMHIQEMNRQMRQWFPDAAAYKSPYCYSAFNDPPLTCACEKCPLVKTLQDGERHEAILTRAEGPHQRILRIIASAIRDDRGQVTAAIELVEDITEKTNMERELLQTAKMASIGQLAAGVAHEINNPTGFVSSNLNTLNGYKEDLDSLLGSYSLLKDALPAAGPELDGLLRQIEKIETDIDIDFIRQDMGDLIRDCRQGTDRIKKIVEDLKHFAHPGQDKVQDTDINKELETTLNVVNNELKYKTTVVRQLADLPIIKANPQQLNQVFVNILVNAAQAIAQSGEIRITTRAVNGFVQIEISDTGCGIAPEHLSRIFEPFFTTKEVGVGTGLGMNIAYNIIKKHEGTIEVASRLGQGTTFTIKLPVALSGAA